MKMSKPEDDREKTTEGYEPGFAWEKGLSQRLRFARINAERNGISIEAMVRMLNKLQGKKLFAALIEGWERAESQPSAPQLFAWSTITGCNHGWLKGSGVDASR